MVCVPLLIGQALVITRTYGAADPELRIRGDSESYIAMAAGVPADSVMVPFRYRVAVPAILSLLPMAPHQALRLVSLAALVATQLILLRIGRRMGIPAPDASATVLLVSLTTAMLYVHHNPFLLDLFTLLMITIAFSGLLGQRPVLFAAAIAIGTAGREACLFMAPAYLLTQMLTRTSTGTSSRVIPVAGMVVPAAVFLIPRMLPALGGDGLSSYSRFYARSAGQWGPERDLVGFIIDVAMSWEWLWFAALGGLALQGIRGAAVRMRGLDPTWASNAVRISFALLTAGGMLVLVINGGYDPARHFLIVAPPLAIASMSALAAWRASLAPWAFGTGVAGLAGLTFLSAMIRLPNRALDSAIRWQMPLWAVVALALGLVAGAFMALAAADARRVRGATP